MTFQHKLNFLLPPLNSARFCKFHPNFYLTHLDLNFRYVIVYLSSFQPFWSHLILIYVAQVIWNWPLSAIQLARNAPLEVKIHQKWESRWNHMKLITIYLSYKLLKLTNLGYPILASVGLRVISLNYWEYKTKSNSEIFMGCTLMCKLSNKVCCT